MKIGNRTIPDLPVDDYDDWLENQLIPAGEQFAAEADEHMGWNGRPVTTMEMVAVRWARSYSAAAIARRWMADFEAFVGGDDE